VAADPSRTAALPRVRVKAILPSRPLADMVKASNMSTVENITPRAIPLPRRANSAERGRDIACFTLGWAASPASRLEVKSGEGTAKSPRIEGELALPIPGAERRHADASQPVGCRVLATRSRRTPLRTDHGEIGELLVPAAYPAVGEFSPVCVIIPLTAAVDQSDDPEKAQGTTNVGLSEGSSGTSLSAVPVGVPHRPRFDEVSTS
jgi:hypothetical protein